MLIDLFVQHTNLSAYETKRLLALPPAALYDDPVYASIVASLDVATIRQTLPYAREVYDDHLQQLKEDHSLGATIMSGHTLGSALVGFLMQPDRMPEMLEKHAILSPETVRKTMPDLVRLLGAIEEGAAEWQNAMLVLSLPLMAGYAPE